jgi:hypothetical protein
LGLALTYDSIKEGAEIEVVKALPFIDQFFFVIRERHTRGGRNDFGRGLFAFWAGCFRTLRTLWMSVSKGIYAAIRGLDIPTILAIGMKSKSLETTPTTKSTFIRQNITTSDEWFTKVPQHQRTGTNPTEKKLYLDRICAIVGRIAAVHARDTLANDRDDFRLTAPTQLEKRKHQDLLPLNGFAHPPGAGQYIPAAFADAGIEPRPDLLYEDGYSPTLRRLVAHVITVEGPIYGDILAVRIARAHGKDRTGSTIQKLVLGAVDSRFPRTHEEDRDLFWPEGSRTDTAFPYRPSAEGVRSLVDTPLAELASIALPFLQSSLSEEEIIEKMAEHFRLERLRRATRARFEAALALARRS